MTRATPLHERAFLVGDILGINAYNINHTSLRQELIAQGYHLQGTPHFLIAKDMGVIQRGVEQTLGQGLGRDVIKQAQTGWVIVVHRFAPREIDANLEYFMIKELKQFDLLRYSQRFRDVFRAVVMSLSPQDPERAWHLYGTNTLARYHALLDNPPREPQNDMPIEVFATLYRRVCELCVGTSLLDAGCSFGFLPLVIAERLPQLARIVGVDIETSPFPTVQMLARERGRTNVEYRQADLLTNDSENTGSFDTVTLLHVLEHFTEEEMYMVLSHLLPLVQHRLLIAVPYEEGVPEASYGHKQLFTPENLENVGKWCVEKMEYGTFRVEECVGGLLVVNCDEAIA